MDFIKSPRNMRGGKCMADVQGAFARAKDAGRDCASFRTVDRATTAQLTVTIGKSGKMRRDMRHGCGAITTSWPKNHKVSRGG